MTQSLDMMDTNGEILFSMRHMLAIERNEETLEKTAIKAARICLLDFGNWRYAP